MTTYENATPELLKNKEQIRDRLKEAYLKTAQECTNLRCVLGLDNPEFLTHMLSNEDFFRLAEDDSQPEFCDKYSKNPQATEEEYSKRLTENAQ